MSCVVEASWNVTAPAQKPYFVFRRNGRVHLNRRGRQFSRLLTAEMCASAVVMLDTPYSEVVWRVLATHSIRQFPLHFPSRASPCAIAFQLESNRNEYHGYLLEGEGGRCPGLTSPPSCTDYLEILSFKFLRPCPGLYRDCFTLPPYFEYLCDCLEAISCRYCEEWFNSGLTTYG